MPADNQFRAVSDPPVPLAPGGAVVPKPYPPPPGLAGYDEDPSVTVLLEEVPEFGPAFLALVELFDDDPGGPAVFTELADFVSERLVAIEAERPVLERTLAAVESVARAGGDAQDLVGYAFLESLSPEDLRLITPWLGAATRSLLDDLDAGLA
ncbi:MAG TPA: hypothetical protein VG205_05125 [Acidimicrobiales bacterium]|nr:hypothetical protein [Acidimicrobiales bacterium]